MRQLRTLLPAAVAVAAAEAQAQRRVTGTVTGEGSAPLPAVSVQVVGTAVGTYTTEAGRFALQVPAGTQTLRARRIGYRARTVVLSPGQTEVPPIALERDVLQLEAQVVTGTATSVSRRNAANAVAVVTAEVLNRVPAPTVENALQGKVAGATIRQNSGAPGGGLQVQLRGASSVNVNSSPLYVVDGVLVSNDAISNGLNAITGSAGGTGASNQDQQVNRIADLNPADIESVEVLKGPSAGSIYGSKAAAGVIVITTKRGQAGRPSMSLTQRLGEFSLLHTIGVRRFTSLQDAVAWDADYGLGDSAFVAKHYQSTPFNSFERDLYGARDLAYETDVAVRGGAGGTSYFVSGLAKRDPGIQRNTGYNKQSLRVNLGQAVGSRLTVTANTNVVHSLTARGVSGNDNTNINPITVFSNTPSFYRLESGPDGYPRNPYLGAYGANPWQTRDLVQTPEDLYRAIGGVTATYNLVASPRQTLDASATGGLDTYSLAQKIVSPRELYYEPADGLPGTVVNRNTNETFANLNASLVHRLTASRAFTATTSLGLRREQRQLASNYVVGQDLLSRQANVDQAVVRTPSEVRTLVRDVAYYVQEEVLTLGERLLLTGAVNAERSSVNGDPQKYYLFPKASASYRLPVLPPRADEVKLRVAYGVAGNQPTYGQKFTGEATTVIDNQSALFPGFGYGNTNIKPERATEVEGGVDASFFRNRLGAELTLFDKTVSDLILTATTPASIGFTSRTINGGRLTNRGVELGLTAVPVQTARVTWTARAVYASLKGRISDLPIPAYNFGGFGLGFGQIRIENGKSPYSIIGRNGYDTTWVRTAAGADSLDANGRRIFQSRAVRAQILGEAKPSFTWGFANEVTAGRFTLSGLVDWRHGGLVSNFTRNYFDATGLAPDVAASAERIRLFGSANRRSIYLEDASFVKLREVTLGYRLPAAVTRRVLPGAGSGVRLELAGRNLYTWTKYAGYDPEVSNFGNQNLVNFIDLTPYPPSRSVFFAVDVTF